VKVKLLIFPLENSIARHDYLQLVLVCSATRGCRLILPLDFAVPSQPRVTPGFLDSAQAYIPPQQNDAFVSVDDPFVLPM